MKLRSVVLGCLLLSCAVASAGPATISLDVGRLGSVPHAAPSATQVAPRTPRLPTALGGSSAENVKLYAGFLTAFEQQVVKQRLPAHDVAVAAAMFVAGAHSAYRGGDVSDVAFMALVGQMRDLLAASPMFTGASVGDRQDMYEMFAIMGTVLAYTAKTKPNEASTREMGKKSLASVFADPDAIRVTDRGLVAGAAAPAASEPARTPAAPAVPTGPVFPSSKIVSIHWHTEMQYEAFPANSMVMREDWMMLLADGTCTDAIPSTLAGWDPAALRAAKPKDWCTWKRDGGGAMAQWTKSKAQVRGTELKGFGKNERVDGTWSRQKTGTVGTASTWRGTTLTLHANGRFELYRAGHFTSTTNPRRGEVVASATGSNENAGTYTLDGFNLELKFDNGSVENMLFAANSTRETARLGGQIVFKK